MQDTVLEEKTRKKWTAIFVAGLVVFTMACFAFLGHKFDSLARYPYKDQNSRELIKQYLNEQEIEYIITYSIPPNMFIAYIQEDGFSIYHASEYKRLSEVQWQASPAAIVRMVEETRSIMDTDTLIEYLREGNYTYEELHAYLYKEDEYAINSSLILHADALTAQPDHTHTLSMRSPNVVPVVDLSCADHVFVAPELLDPLLSMSAAMQRDLNSEEAFAGVRILRGYVSYEQQKLYYEQDRTTDLPGHSDRQLGTCVDLQMDGLTPMSFAKTPQYEWLKSNAYRFGFVQTESAGIDTAETHGTHWRYVGPALARQLADSKLSLEDYLKGIAES